jgi:hypothetical protein
MLEISRHILENSPISNLMKIRPVSAMLFHVDRWTDEQTNAHAPTSVLCEFQKNLP